LRAMRNDDGRGFHSSLQGELEILTDKILTGTAINELAVSIEAVILAAMNIYYTARETYGEGYDADVMAWAEYLEWSKLSHLRELVSVDFSLNELLVEPDRDNEEDWKYIVLDGDYETGFYTSLDYVLRKMQPKERFNFLAVAINPAEECKDIKLHDFDFLGYDLLDQEYTHSALSNCGGFDETFLPSDLNQFGLLYNFEKANDIQMRLLKNNPDEHHADTNVIAIWRHKSIGREKAER
jgi:hypothetical protein